MSTPLRQALAPWRLTAVLTALVCALDLATKAIVRADLALHSRHEVIAGVFNVVHAQNPGAAFGLLAGLPPSRRIVILVGLSVLATGLVLAMHHSAWRERRLTLRLRVALALVLGGALGNLVDRILRGAVVDWLDFYWGQYHWPAFNLADVAIVAGVGVLLLDAVRPHGEPERVDARRTAGPRERVVRTSP